jgi:hypothetical protein
MLGQWEVRSMGIRSGHICGNYLHPRHYFAIRYRGLHAHNGSYHFPPPLYAWKKWSVVASVPNGPVGQVLSYGPVGQSIPEGWTRPDQISWSSQVGPCFGLVRPGFVLQTRKLSIRASARTCANSFL